MKKEQLQKKLSTCKREYERTKRIINDVGFITEGSIVKVYSRCGKKNCQCSEAKQLRHGPYYQLTWKKNGKTVSRFLSKQTEKLFKEWVENRNRVKQMISKMNKISFDATQCICEINNITDPRCKTKKVVKKS